MQFVPNQMALIIVDMQNAYCHENGSLSRQGFDISACRKVVAGVKELIEIGRKHHLPIIFLYLAFEKDYRDAGKMIHQIWPFFKEKEGLIDGTWDAGIVDELKPLPGDLVIRKTRYSGFSGTNLDHLLRYKRIDTLVFAGVTTNICVESTIRDAHHLDYGVVLISDATAEIDELRFNASLKAIEYAFGRVMRLAEFESLLSNP